MSSRGVPSATIAPLRITTMRSASSTASSTSCVTITVVSRMRSCRRRYSPPSASRVSGSSAPNGSSMSMMAGRAASARATPTRWRCPPTARPDTRLANLRRQTHEREQLRDARGDVAFVPAEQPRRDADVLRHRHMRKQADALKDVADSPPQLIRRPRARRLTIDEHLARVRLEQAVDHLERRRLARARLADDRDELPRIDSQVDGLQRNVGRRTSDRRARIECAARARRQRRVL